MNNNLFVVIAASAIYYGTPLFFAGLGEVITERSGVLNLGVEGMMLLGAVAGSGAAANVTGPTWWVLLVSVLAAMLAGGLGALLHAFAVVTLRVNQTVSGLALTILAGGAGLSSYLANLWELKKAPVQFQKIDVFGLRDVPILGPILFHQNALTYLSWALAVGSSWYLFRSRRGLHLRSVGESPQTADAVGINVTRYRYVHTIVGGTLAGIGGAFVSLAINTTWADGVTAGQGWIAIALVIFGFWRPDLTLAGAYLFGAFTSLSFTLQERGVSVPPQFLDSLPYVMTIVVLVAVSSGWAKRRLGAPAALGVPYEREER
ncbi:MAG: ABC transporter permease [Acidimicrobiales bacterium]